MALRRPRIKPTALLTTKRKSRDIKSEHTLKPTKDDCMEYKNDETANRRMVDEGSESKDTIVTNEANDKSSGRATPVESGNNQNRTDDVCTKDIQESLERDYQNVASNTTIKIAQTENISTGKQKTYDGKNEISKNKENKLFEKTDSSFKCPARVEYMRSNSQVTPNLGPDDVFYTDMEESILQLDMQKAIPEKTATPLKQQARQRIRPVPLFQRRNSFASTTSPVQGSSEDITVPIDMQSQDTASISEGDATETVIGPKIKPLTHRRERHYSASMVPSPLTTNSGIGQHHYTPQKFTPSMGVSRIRTESNCSAFSDSFVLPSKLRKNDEHSNRPNSRRDLSWRIVNGNLDKSSLKMFDLIYYNPVTNPMEKRTTMSTIKKESTIDEIETKQATVDSKAELTDGTNNAMPVPQLKLNSNGDLILDEKTLEIETTAEQEARKVLANSSLIFLDENTGMNGFYKRQKRTKEWPPAETIKFYRCLQTVGTDFSLMCQLFPKRTRRDLKLKFKKEERSNLALINKALLYPKLFNIDDLKMQLDTEEREREEALQHWKEIHAKEAKTIKKVKINASTAARALKNGDDVYENENVIKRKLSSRSNLGEKKRIDSAKKSKTSLPQHTITNPENTIAAHLKKRKLRPKETELPKSSEATATTEPVQLHSSPTVLLPTMPKEILPVKFEFVNATNSLLEAEHYSSHESNFLNSQTHQLNTVEKESRSDQNEEFLSIAPTSVGGVADSINEIITPNNTGNDINYALTAEIETKTFVDLDDGTVKMLQEEEEDLSQMDGMPATPLSISQRDVDECDIQQILIDLADGSLVLVSTLDPDNADQVVNEIYMMDKITGELCDKPLDIPESIVLGVLSVMN